jgi:hypothetical protein
MNQANRRWKGLIVFTASLLWLPVNRAASASTAASPNRIQDATDPFVKGLEGQYDRFVKAQKQGDVAAYEKYRSAAGLAFMKGHLSRNGKLKEMSQMLSTMPNYEIRDFTFVQEDRRTDIARLVFGREKPRQDARGGITTALLLIFFRREGGQWKVDNVGHLRSTEAGIRGLEGYPMFLLPGELFKIKGSVRRIDLPAKSLSVQDRFGRLKDIAVKQNVVFERKGQPVSIKDLQLGDEVIAMVTKDTYNPFAME